MVNPLSNESHPCQVASYLLTYSEGRDADLSAGFGSGKLGVLYLL